MNTKQIKVIINYSDKLCGQMIDGQIIGGYFKYCSMVDNDCSDYCHAYEKHLNLDKDRHPYRCNICRKRNK